MLVVTPADVSDELDAVYADRVKRIKFHTSVKTIFGQTRSRSPRRNALGGDEVQSYISTFMWFNLLNLMLAFGEIVLPPVYISAQVYILHGPSVEELKCH